MKPKLLIICGPTATGKTDLAVDLAKKYNGEIVSADSRQVYRGMDIITGKDIGKAKIKIENENFTIGYYPINNVKLWLTDVVDPRYQFNISEYVDLANKVIKDILSRGKLPIIVGGTGFYLRGLFGQVDTLGIPPDPRLRKKLEKLSVAALQNELDKFDQLVQLNKLKLNSLNQSDRNNPRRLIRAIEVATYHYNQQPACRQGRPTINNQQLPDEPHDYNTLCLGLSTGYEKLYPRIDQRVDERIRAGAEKEIRHLLKSGYNWDNSALGVTIGYRQWRDYFDSKATREEVIEKWRFAEHAYARRQMTWFKKEKQINWFDIDKPSWRNNIYNKVNDWSADNKS